MVNKKTDMIPVFLEFIFCGERGVGVGDGDKIVNRILREGGIKVCICLVEIRVVKHLVFRERNIYIFLNFQTKP